MVINPINTEPLYKYMTAQVAAIVLVNRTIRYSSPILFDDPLDVARRLDLGFPIEELEKLIVSEVERMFFAKDFSEIKFNPPFKALAQTLCNKAPQEVKDEFIETLPEQIRAGSLNASNRLEELNEAWQELLPQMRILCFSTEKDIMPMWATYGDNHKGVALEFHPQISTDSPWLLARPVTYTDEPMAIATPMEWTKFILGIEKFDKSIIFERYGTVKTKSWSFQKEARFFSFMRANETGLESDYKFFATDLKAIYFGYNAEEKDIEILCDLIAHDFSHVKPFRCKFNDDFRNFEYEEIAH